MERERLLFCIERWDHYYDSTNNKGSVFLGLSTFIVGGLVAGYPSILELVNCTWWINVLMIALIGLGLAIMLIVISALMPYLSKPDSSLLYFGSVCATSHEDFCSRSGAAAEDAYIEDLRKQSHQLAKGLAKKFKKLRIAGMLFTIQFYLAIPLILLIIFNLK